MENNIGAINATVNLVELIALVGGGLYFDRRIRRLEGRDPLSFQKHEQITESSVSSGKSNIDLEKSIATLSRRLDTHEDILSKILLNLEPKSDEDDDVRTEGGSRSIRLNVSPGRTGSILKKRSRIIPTEKLPEDPRSIRDDSPGKELKIDLGKYNDLD